MGRPKGSKTSFAHHKAGGAGRGQGRPPNPEPQPIRLNPWTLKGQAPTVQPPTLPEVDDEAHKVGGTCIGVATPDQPSDDDGSSSQPELLAYDLEAEERDLYNSDDEDDDSDFEEDEDDEDTDDDESIDIGNVRHSNRYMPPKDSPLYLHLMIIKDKILNDCKNGKYGCHWVPPMFDPLVKAGGRNAENWYLSDVWVYSWLPFKQYETKLSRSSCRCIYCKHTGVHMHEYRYRPCFYFDKIVWILHARVQCPNCQKKFTEIDPRFLSNLPTNVVERFEFLLCRKGPGIHQMMMAQFLSTCTDGILFAKYCQSINQMQRLRYDIKRIGYYDCIHDFVTEGIGASFKIRPQVYPVFMSEGFCNGILLTTRMMKRFFLSYMQSRAEYYQSSFQFCNDDGASADHSHKFSRKISCGKRTLFNASYSIMSLSGQVSSLRLTFGKSNDEIQPVLEDLKKTRLNIGVPLLKRFETDNIKGDGAVWTSVFPELKDDISTPIMDETKATIDEKSIVYIDKIESANVWALSWEDDLQDKEQLLIGLDTEWCPTDGLDAPARILQIQVDDHPTAVFNLSKMRVSEKNVSFPRPLKDFLECPNIVACGVNIGIDCAKLQHFGVVIKNRLDIRQLALRHSSEQAEGLSLQALAKKYLGLVVDKSLQCGNWKEYPLPQQMIQYAALDCLISKQLVNKLNDILQTSSSTVGPLVENAAVDFTSRGRVIARGVVIFIGGGGKQFRWGNMTVGEKKAIIKLTDVLAQGQKLPINHPNQNVITFGDVMRQTDTTIAVHTSSLRLSDTTLQSPWARTEMHGKDENTDEFYDCKESAEESQTEEINPARTNLQLHDVLGTPEISQLNQDADTELNIDDDDEENRKLYSRGKEDIFHAYKKLPLPKTCPFRSSITNALILATFSFVQEDFDAYTTYLKTQYNVDDDEILDHFFFNKEEWRKYVRMCVHPPATHASNVSRVHHFIRTNEVTKHYYNTDVRDYFESFESKCRSGLFEEINDVQMFQWAGVGKYGLDRWFRRRGTVRNENLHQKLDSCIAAHSIGAEIGHHLLVLVAYKYNITTRIQRMGLLNHGHFFHEYIDRIQNRVLELFDAVVYESHRNCSALRNPIEKYIAVGVGPLSYDSRYVTFGPVHPDLRGHDLRFVAASMGLELPPLEVSSKEERKIFNDFRRSHPNGSKLSASQLVELSELYKSRANGTTIFPKLPSQLAAHDNKFIKNSVIKITARKISAPYNELLKGLSSVTCTERFEFLNDVHDDELMIHTNDLMNTDEPAKTQQSITSESNFVPPFVAPLQTQYKNAGDASFTAQETRKCAFYPLCKQMARDCNGWKLTGEKCSTLKLMGDSLPDDYIASIEEAKKKERNEEKRKAAKRAREKN